VFTVYCTAADDYLNSVCVQTHSKWHSSNTVRVSRNSLKILLKTASQLVVLYRFAAFLAQALRAV